MIRMNSAVDISKVERKNNVAITRYQKQQWQSVIVLLFNNLGNMKEFSLTCNTNSQTSQCRLEQDCETVWDNLYLT
jgi:hypothetical protein